jgi:hypothetical protein
LLKKLDCFAALAMMGSVIARSEATKQSSFVAQKLDCFAALAMTGRATFFANHLSSPLGKNISLPVRGKTPS